MSGGLDPKRHGERGAVLVETALTVGIILTILLFSVQAGVLGFLQLTFDAASFVDARLAAVGVSNTTPGAHANSTSAIFRQVSPSQITSTVAPAPSPSVPVDYGYNSTNASQQAASITDRHGGVSMMLPTQQTSTIAKPSFFKIFGKSVGVASQSVDALWLECGIHVNVSNGNNSCSPAAVGAGSAAYAGNYFSSGEDAPPYFVGLNHFHHCTDAQPYSTCTTAGSDFLAIGSAEFLHGPAGNQTGNWTNALPGAGGDSYATTFWLMGCHQRTFAVIAAALVPYATLTQYYNATNSWAAANGYGSVTNAEAIYYQLNAVDGSWPYSATYPSKRGMNSFANGPPGLSNWVIDFDQTTDTYVGRVYGWDTQVAAGAQPGTVGSNATYPQNYCYYP